jgi:hypothetical protein
VIVLVIATDISRGYYYTGQHLVLSPGEQPALIEITPTDSGGFNGYSSQGGGWLVLAENDRATVLHKGELMRCDIHSGPVTAYGVRGLMVDNCEDEERIKNEKVQGFCKSKCGTS